MISIQELILRLGFSQPQPTNMYPYKSIQSSILKVSFHTFLILASPLLLFFCSSSSSSSLFSSSLLFYGFWFSKMRPNLVLNPIFKLRPCLAFAFLNIFLIFLQLGPSILYYFYSIFSLIALNPITSSIYISFFSNSILAYKLMVLCLSYPQVVND